MDDSRADFGNKKKVSFFEIFRFPKFRLFFINCSLLANFLRYFTRVFTCSLFNILAVGWFPRSCFTIPLRPVNLRSMSHHYPYITCFAYLTYRHLLTTGVNCRCHQSQRQSSPLFEISRSYNYYHYYCYYDYCDYYHCCYCYCHYYYYWIRLRFIYLRLPLLDVHLHIPWIDCHYFHSALPPQPICY